MSFRAESAGPYFHEFKPVIDKRILVSITGRHGFTHEGIYSIDYDPRKEGLQIRRTVAH